MASDVLTADRAAALAQAKLLPVRVVIDETGIPFGNLVLMVQRGEFPELYEVAPNRFVVLAAEYRQWKASRLRTVATKQNGGANA
jgi:hypothetical protein